MHLWRGLLTMLYYQEQKRDPKRRCVLNTISARTQLNRQIDELPDDIVAEIADFTAFVLARRRIPTPYLEWTEGQWETLSLGQFLRDSDDDIEYTIDDAEEVYQR